MSASLFLDLIGLTLEQARAQLSGVEFVTIETQARPSRASVPVWGELRVLRARNIENGVELLLARELLKDERKDERVDSVR